MEKEIDSEAEVRLYLMVLDKLNKTEKKLRVLDGPPGEWELSRAPLINNTTSPACYRQINPQLAMVYNFQYTGPPQCGHFWDKQEGVSSFQGSP